MSEPMIKSAEQIALVAESLERQLWHIGGSEQALLLVDEIINNARELHAELSEGGVGDV